jgi:hypothetical protein
MLGEIPVGSGPISLLSKNSTVTRVEICITLDGIVPKSECELSLSVTRAVRFPRLAGSCPTSRVSFTVAVLAHTKALFSFPIYMSAAQWGNVEKKKKRVAVRT